ncbi:MAG TPA: hypothetical protein VGE97_10770 [Nitrososphaera sp.]
MGFLYDDLPKPKEGRMWWSGLIATNPASFDEPIYITLPDFDPNLRIGPCLWQSRGDNLLWEYSVGSLETDTQLRPHDLLPKRGNPCLVVFDQRHIPWVVVWWPYGS